jgi:hypothetical protein
LGFIPGLEIKINEEKRFSRCRGVKREWKNLEMEEREIIGICARETEMNSKEGAKFEDARQLR